VIGFGEMLMQDFIRQSRWLALVGLILKFKVIQDGSDQLWLCQCYGAIGFVASDLEAKKIINRVFGCYFEQGSYVTNSLVNIRCVWTSDDGLISVYYDKNTVAPDDTRVFFGLSKAKFYEASS
jgi:hypothetical protein